MVAEFNEHPNSSGRAHTQALVDTLLREEVEELRIELDFDGPVDLRAVARECADVVYVVYTAAWAFGIDLDAALAEVHRAAMDKMEANVRRPEDGKIIKPPGFVPPDMSAAVAGLDVDAAGFPVVPSA